MDRKTKELRALGEDTFKLLPHARYSGASGTAPCDGQRVKGRSIPRQSERVITEGFASGGDCESSVYP